MTSSEGGSSDLSCAGVMLQCVSHSEALDQHTSQAQTPSGPRQDASGYMSQTGPHGYFAWHTEVR